MGNQLAQPQRLQPEHLAELPNVVLKDTLGGQYTSVEALDTSGQLVVLSGGSMNSCRWREILEDLTVCSR